MNKNGKNGFSTVVKVLVIFFGIIFFISCVDSFLGNDEITDKDDYVYDDGALNVISSSENEVLDSSINIRICSLLNSFKYSKFPS